jgi:hypothetical protein
MNAAEPQLLYLGYIDSLDSAAEPEGYKGLL